MSYMSQTHENNQESLSLKPPDLKPALRLFEESISQTIIKWFNANKKDNEKETLVYNHLLNNPMVVGLSLEISSLEKQLAAANEEINNLKLQIKNASSDVKNVTLDITEIEKDSVIEVPEIEDDNQKQLNQVVK